MKNLFNTGIFIPTLVIMAILFVSGCIPGAAQTRHNDYYDDITASGVDDYDFQDANTANTNNSQSNARTTQVNYEPETGPISGGENSGDEKYYQKGYASWYGREFQGKVTASGERFNMNDYTAAHKELPFGTIADVKNIKSGRIVRVKINDRGPYRDNRIVDLSYAAANELGFVREGETMVGITIVKWGDGARKSTTDQSASNDYDSRDFNDTNDAGANTNIIGNYTLQTGAFYSQQNADNFKETLKGLTNKPVIIVNDNGMYKVRIEGLVDQNDVKETKRILQNENISSFLVR